MTKFFDTDNEAGEENLNSDADKQQAIRALHVMLDRGLIDEKIFQIRLKDIKNAD